MSKELNKLFIVLNKNHVSESFFKFKKDLFTFNKYIIPEKYSSKINHFYPKAINTSIESKSLFLITQEVKEFINKELKKQSKYKDIKNIDELLDPFIEIKVSSYLYMKSVIPDYNKYVLIYKNKTLEYNSKIDLIIAIELINSNKKNSQYNYISKFSDKKVRFYNILFMNIQSFLLKKLLFSNSNSFYFLSDRKAYFMTYLFAKHKKNRDNILYFSPNRSFLSTLRILFIQLINLLVNGRYKEIGFFLLINKRLETNKFEYKYSDLDIVNKHNLDIRYINLILNESNKLISITIDFSEYLKRVLRQANIKNSFFHTVRFPDNYAISRAILKIRKKVYLISHGSHTIQNDSELNKSVSKLLGLGMSYSHEKSIRLLSQSKLCDDYLDSFNKKYSKINFIISQNQFPTKTTQNPLEKKTEILYVGTVKELGSRRYYYESSQEFIESIKNIYQKIYKYRNKFTVNIRIRDVHNEIDRYILERAFKKLKDVIKINDDSPLINALNSCDCIISYSSTVLEEGININKPVMCYGLPEYNHLKFYERFENKKIDKNLKIIETCLKRKFIFNNKVLRNIDYKL